ncbi:MAG: CHAT domain-containing tetratricopeptide repeat protein [Myxococcota bacterium]
MVCLVWLATLGGLPAPVRAAPAEAVVEAAVESAGLALGAHTKGAWEDAARHGLDALKVLGPGLGWAEPDVVTPVMAVTVDSLMKLGRTDEADALLAKRKAALAKGGATSSKKAEPAEANTPMDAALGVAAKAYRAFVLGQEDEALRLGVQAARDIEAIDPNAPSLPEMRSLAATLHGARLEFGPAVALLTANLEASRRANAAVDEARWTMALARLSLQQGDVKAARAGYEAAAALGLAQRDLETQARAAGGLGDVASLEQRNAAAIKRYRQALALHERRQDFGASHLVAPLHDLGVTLEQAGQFDEALSVLMRCVAIAERSFGQTTPATWNVKHSLGRLHRSAKRYDEAIALFEAVLAEQEAQLPPTSPGIAATMNHLAETLWAKGGSRTRVVGLATRAAEVHERAMASVLRSGTEAQKRAYLARYTSGTDRILSYAARDAADEPSAVRLGAATVLRRKGRLLDAVSDQFALLRSRADVQTGAKLDRLTAAQAQLAALALRGPDESLPAKEHAALTDSLRDEVDALTKDLADVVPPDEQGTVQLEDVAARLGADEVLVEWVLYQPFDVHYRSMNTAFGPARYAAFVVHADGTTGVVDLGEASRIDDAIVAMRRAVADPRTDPTSLGRQLHGWLTAKVEPLLKGKTSVYLSPDGMLNLLPFAALVGDDGKHLVTRYTFTYLSSGRDLVRLQGRETPRSDALIVGAPAFSASGSGAGTAGAGTRAAGLSDLVFPPLPGTAGELDALQDVVPQARVRRADAATESTVKKADAPVVLHVATHGFFLADDRDASAGSRGVTYVKGDAVVRPSPDAENPLIRSGLAFAGANLRAGPDGEDGILTALELASANLHGTELVVLSACETGVGEVRNGDGVYGLRRALVIAGSRSQVMSLWQVDDEATRDLMAAYYRRLRKGDGRSEALRAVQLKMRKKKETAHPFYWAAFIPSGDASSMELALPEPERARSRRRRQRDGLDLLDYWGDAFDDPMLTVGGSYLGVLGTPRLDGIPAEHARGWDVRVRGFTRPHLQLGFDLSRQVWRVPQSERRTKLNVNRLEFILGIDLLPLPYDLRVRPALIPYAALGLAWGKLRDSPSVNSRIDPSVGGAGATLGADFVLYVRPTERFLIGLRGGVSKPYYRLRAESERLALDDQFPRALRWQVGIDLGATP